MPRIYSNPKPSQNKASEPIKETKKSQNKAKPSVDGNDKENSEE